MSNKQIEYLLNKRKRELEKQYNEIRQRQNASGNSFSNFKNGVSKVNKAGKAFSKIRNAIQDYSYNPGMQSFGRGMSEFGGKLSNFGTFTPSNQAAMQTTSNMGGSGLIGNNTAVSHIGNAGLQTAGNMAANTAGTAASNTMGAHSLGGSAAGSAAESAASSSGASSGVPWLMIASMIKGVYDKNVQKQRERINNSINEVQRIKDNNIGKADKLLNKNDKEEQPQTDISTQLDNAQSDNNMQTGGAQINDAENSNTSSVVENLLPGFLGSSKKNGSNTDLDNGNFTGGAASIISDDKFEDIRNQRQGLINDDKRALQNLGNSFKDNLNKASRFIKNDVLDSTSDMKGSVLYDYRSPKTLNKLQSQGLDVYYDKNENRHEFDYSNLMQPAETAENNNITIDSPAGQKILADYAASRKMQLNTVPNMPIPAISRETPQFEIIEPPQNNYNLPALPAGVNTESDYYQQPVISADNMLQTVYETPAESQEKQELPYNGRFKGLINGAGDFVSGFKDNYDNAFNPKNLIPQNKNKMTKFGEAAGTMARLAQNPLVQGAAAGLVSGIAAGSPLAGISSGYKFASRKQMNDIYNQVLKENGFNVPSGIFSNLSSSDVNAIMTPRYKAETAALDRQYKEAQINNQNLENKYRNERLKNERERLEFEKKKDEASKHSGKTNEKPNWNKDLSDLYEILINPAYKEYRTQAVKDFYKEYGVDPYKYLTLPKNTPGSDYEFDEFADLEKLRKSRR